MKKKFSSTLKFKVHFFPSLCTWLFDELERTKLRYEPDNIFSAIKRRLRKISSVYRVVGSDVDGSGSASFTGNNSVLSEEKYKTHRGFGWPGYSARLPFHFLRLAVPPVVLQLRHSCR